jgi:hypothetical protein
MLICIHMKKPGEIETELAAEIWAKRSVGNSSESQQRTITRAENVPSGDISIDVFHAVYLFSFITCKKKKGKKDI